MKAEDLKLSVTRIHKIAREVKDEIEKVVLEAYEG